jgi:bifunctional UDP-N-acetylglucosamine pyrophosphorylase / glucosamine-1-phosphate N-acetyltransferase
MQSKLPKVLHPVAGLPMVEHVTRAARAASPGQLLVTLGEPSAALRGTLGADVDYAWQADALGTGDAVAVALPLLRASIAWVVVVYGDHPLTDTATLCDLMDAARRAQPLVALLAVRLAEPGPYGRYIYRAGRIVGTVEAHEDTTVYTAPTLVNSGMCCYRREWLEEHIRQLPLSPKGEYYLTALVERAAATNWPTDPVLAVEAPEEVALGVNDRVELAHAEALMRRRINAAHMRAGVTLVDPDATYIDARVELGPDTRIEPGCALRGATSIGSGCVIGPHTVIADSHVGDEVSIKSSWIETATVGSRVQIGPFAHLRPGAHIADDVHLGNHVEIKNASIGSHTHIGHFSYVGDATLGERVNVGAGTITCNYDGCQKHQTHIGDDVFLGSDTLLVAPVSVGAGARTGAGAVVTRSVPPGELAVGVPARVRSRSSGATLDEPDTDS